ncbi:hypothetical protein PAAG_04802 [Paracoccidioides lutzii Pb01]|uniref:Uncharacterized protein n=1 Tax=Paracoccidioides lutzii (strain ATCC MYA-826 / Pb01) TaxID=502779 RepID=C1H1L6_PARBA|nr:hypothetical protein PAAG_04802 [Paracoccidioides lutzii Pb01]EEH33753.1 hypothetical protein PAAG_04802 [Paracoccidioides lutzii Pb01]
MPSSSLSISERTRISSHRHSTNSIPSPYATFSSPPPYSAIYTSSTSPPHSSSPQNPDTDHTTMTQLSQSQQARFHRRHHRCSTSVQLDIIDRLDNIGLFCYHHEGPYDAASRAQNSHPCSSKLHSRNPIDALQSSIEEALKATPPDKIADCIRNHRPLDGVAYYAPGTTDPNGHKYDYEEGWNMMTEDTGNFKRWPGMKFRDEDFKNDPGYMALINEPRRKLWSFRRRKQKQKP